MTDNLRKVFEADGPFVSLYLDNRAAMEDAAQQRDIRWRDVQRTLADSGLDKATVEAVTAARGDIGAGDTRVVIAANGRVLLATYLPDAPGPDRIVIDGLPHLVPLIRDASLQLPHVFALVDRAGADVVSYSDLLTVADTSTVSSDDLDIRRVNAGGWSHRRFQMRALDSWEETGKRVAAEITEHAAEVSARLVVLAGDVHEVGAVRSHLPAHLVDHVQVIDGGRSADGSEQQVEIDRSATVRQHRLDEIAAFVQRFNDRAGEGRLTATGVADVADALAQGRVDTLLIPETHATDAKLAFGRDLAQIAQTSEALAQQGADIAGEAPAIDVLVRAAVGTAAHVLVIPEAVEGAPRDIAALLRFDL